MRATSALLLLFLLPACATTARIVTTSTGADTSLAAVARDLAGADVVALGELHRTPAVHRTHHALIAALHERRPDLVIAMEMFERDVQTSLLQYLTGMIDEATFRAGARPWPDYDRDYRPVVEFAKANGLVVLAANAPKPLVSKVAKEGLAAVAGEANLARTSTPPSAAERAAFDEAMQGHPGASAETMARMLEAQGLRDDTMAEAITDHLAERAKSGGKPLVVLICGRHHSDHGRGTVARILARMPDLDVRVLSAETMADVRAPLPERSKALGAYVVVAPEMPRSRAVMAPALGGPAVGGAATKPKDGPPAASVPTPAPEAAAAEDLRPALGLMPDYAGEEGGVKVGSVREGGAAEKAGIEAGDVIVMLAGQPVADVEGYTEILDGLVIGKTVTVRIRRDGAEADLQVSVGSRPNRR
jgi:uncharacterized iron-regulated protein